MPLRACEYIDFTFRSMFRLTKFGGNNPQILCIPASSKELDKLDKLGDLNKDEVSKQIAKFYSKKLKLDFYDIDVIFPETRLKIFHTDTWSQRTSSQKRSHSLKNCLIFFQP